MYKAYLWATSEYEDIRQVCVFAKNIEEARALALQANVDETVQYASFLTGELAWNIQHSNPIIIDKNNRAQIF